MQEDQGQRFAVLPPEQPGHVVTERWYLPPPAPLRGTVCGWGQLLGSAVRQADIRGSRRMEVTVTLAAEGGRRWCREGEGAATEEGAQSLLPFNPPTPQPAALCCLHADECFSIILSLSLGCWNSAYFSLLSITRTTLHHSPSSTGCTM